MIHCRVTWIFGVFATDCGVNSTKRVLITILCLLLLTGTVFAGEGMITDLKTDCTVLADGTCQVAQTVTVEITGIEQTLSFPAGTDAKRVTLAGYSPKKSVQDDCVVLTLQNDTGFTGTRTFTLSYTLDDLVTETDGIQTIKLPLLAPRWKYPILRYRFSVSMPKPFTEMPAFSSGYYADSIEDYLNVTVSDAQIGGESTQALLDHESMDMTLVVGEHYFSGTYARWSVDWVAAVLLWLLVAAALAYWFFRLHRRWPRRSVRSVPPDGVIPGELPYLLAGVKPDFNMIVLYWAQLGYLSIAVSRKGHIRLQKRVEMGNERRRLEQKLFQALFVRGDVCDGESLVYKRAAQQAMNLIPGYWRRRIYEKDSGNPVILRLLSALAGGLSLFSAMSLLLPVMPLRWLVLIVAFAVGMALSLAVQLGAGAWVLRRRWLVCAAAASAVCLLAAGNFSGSMATMLPAVLLAVFCGIVMLHGGKLTESGSRLLSQISGFRRSLFAQDPSRLEAQLYRDGQYYYRMLPYAEAMGFGAAFSNSFDDLVLEPCDWYIETKPLPKKASEFYSRLQRTLDTLSLSIRR